MSAGPGCSKCRTKLLVELAAQEFTTQVQQKGIELAEILADWEAVNLRLEAAIEGGRAVGLSYTSMNLCEILAKNFGSPFGPWPVYTHTYIYMTH